MIGDTDPPARKVIPGRAIGPSGWSGSGGFSPRWWTGNCFGVAGAPAPLCDKRLVVLNNLRNANADFNLMTNVRTDPNGTNAADTRTGDVPIPGRLVGQVFNDIYFDRSRCPPPARPAASARPRSVRRASPGPRPPS